MLPYSDHYPSGARELAVCVFVAVLVLADLLTPKAFMGFGGAEVLQARVPEAALEEDGDLGTGKDEIGCAAELGQWAGVDAVSEP